MNYRKLRIAWSVAWGLLAVLLCVLWVRSYSAGIVVHTQATRTRAIKVVSQRGFLGAVLFDPSDAPRRYDKWGLGGADLESFAEPSWDIQIRPKPDIFAQAMIPWWFVVLIVSVTSYAAVRGEWRFSLRTLLIAMTLVGVMLGVVVWMSRAG